MELYGDSCANSSWGTGNDPDGLHVKLGRKWMSEESAGVSSKLVT